MAEHSPIRSFTRKRVSLNRVFCSPRVDSMFSSLYVDIASIIRRCILFLGVAPKAWNIGQTEPPSTEYHFSGTPRKKNQSVYRFVLFGFQDFARLASPGKSHATRHNDDLDINEFSRTLSHSNADKRISIFLCHCRSESSRCQKSTYWTQNGPIFFLPDLKIKFLNFLVVVPIK
jgi:hypothetical protein